MTKAEMELQRRVTDLENAMRTIGQVLRETTMTPKRRVEQVVGILRMYVYDSPPAPPAEEKSA